MTLLIYRSWKAIAYGSAGSNRSDYPPKEYVIQQLAHYLGLDREELMCLTGRLPERYQDFLKENYKVMPSLFRWMRQEPDFLLKSLGE